MERMVWYAYGINTYGQTDVLPWDKKSITGVHYMTGALIYYALQLWTDPFLEEQEKLHLICSHHSGEAGPHGKG